MHDSSEEKLQPATTQACNQAWNAKLGRTTAWQSHFLPTPKAPTHKTSPSAMCTGLNPCTATMVTWMLEWSHHSRRYELCNVVTYAASSKVGGLDMLPAGR